MSVKAKELMDKIVSAKLVSEEENDEGLLSAASSRSGQKKAARSTP